MRIGGAIDMHVHAGPDVRPRKMSAPELARAARLAGMGGLLLKSHHVSTVQVAAALSECFPDLRVFGGLALNEWIGGFNVAAVEAALRMGAAEIWMPTWSAANERAWKNLAGGLAIIDAQGRLIAPVREILALCREHDAVIGTGHLSPCEIAVLVREARSMGHAKILVTHPEISFVNLPVVLQKELAGPGVYFERCYARAGFTLDWDGLARSIREVGADSTVLATDLGQPANPDPIAGFAQMLDEMGARGLSEDELAVMSRENPRRLLNLQ